MAGDSGLTPELDPELAPETPWWRSPAALVRLAIVAVAGLPLLPLDPLDRLFWSLWLLPFAYTLTRSARAPERLWRGLLRGGLFGLLGFALGALPVYLFAPRWLVEWRMAPLIAAIDRYHTEHGLWPRDEGDIVPKYLRAVPTCPNGTMYDVFGPWGSRGLELLAGPPDRSQAAPPPILTCGLGYVLKYTWRFEPRGWTEWD